MEYTTIPFRKKLYTLSNKCLLEIKQAIESYIRVEEAIMTKRGHPRFQARVEFPPHHQSPTRTSKINTKENIYDRLIFTKLMTTPFTTTCVKVVIAIKEKDIYNTCFK
jgi:hypothetical protein